MKKVLTYTLLLFGMMVATPNTTLSIEEKKEIYSEIKCKLDSGKITLDKAQKLWVKKAKKKRRK